eukprot:TRINITY_DN8236_c0_g1_i1.p1 TRINITY_DN8236_c0_g1~~TRINITY_DN8236_c0_g1_i1.p1  ORF type:complete len:611 (-),score=148.15 TRINITY_DN8236_c0_g1_i1:36-1868(-)
MGNTFTCCDKSGKNDGDGGGNAAGNRKASKGKRVSLTDSELHPSARPEIDVKDMTDPNDYDFMNILGAGSYGKVIRVRDKKNPTVHYAMKIMDKKQIRNIHGNSHLSRVKRERKYLREIGNRHPYLMSMIGEINTRNRVYMLLTLCRGGDLGEFLDRHGPVSEQTAKILIAELLLALAKLHAHWLVHRDVRPHNIMIDDDGHIRLSDLGIAGRISRTPGSPMQMHSTVIGATGYKAPEMLAQKEGYDFSVDYWSVGIVFYELLFNRHPFKEVQRKARKKYKESYNPSDYTKDKIDTSKQPISDEARDFLFKFLEIDVKKRYGWKPEELRKRENELLDELKQQEVQRNEMPKEQEMKPMMVNIPAVDMTPEEKKEMDDFMMGQLSTPPVHEQHKDGLKAAAIAAVNAQTKSLQEAQIARTVAPAARREYESAPPESYHTPPESYHTPPSRMDLSSSPEDEKYEKRPLVDPHALKSEDDRKISIAEIPILEETGPMLIIQPPASPTVPEGSTSAGHHEEEASSVLPAPTSPVREPEESIPMPSEEIRNHPFFAGLDWDALSRRQIESPIKKSIEKRLTRLDPDEKPHYPNHLAALDEFNRRDPTVLIAEVFA